MNVNQLIKKLFQKDDGPKPAKVPLVSEALERSKREEWDYAEWLGSGRYRDLMPLIHQSILDKKAGNVPSLDMHLHLANTANGFFFCQHSGFSKTCMGYLLEYFKDRVLQSDYYLSNSVREFEEEPDRIKITESYYLKPSIKLKMEKPAKQLYGNIHLEFVSYNDKPEFLKVMVTTYSGASYQPAIPFESFLQFLFDVNS